MTVNVGSQQSQQVIRSVQLSVSLLFTYFCQHFLSLLVGSMMSNLRFLIFLVTGKLVIEFFISIYSLIYIYIQPLDLCNTQEGRICLEKTKVFGKPQYIQNNLESISLYLFSFLESVKLL